MSISLTSIHAADAPGVTISNGDVVAKLYLPDATRGFYRGTRFDWSGVIHSLRAVGHEYYGPWFTKADPPVHDFVYQGDDIVAGACSAVTGPADEFKALGWEEAKAGGTFVKIGVGALTKPDEKPYDTYRLYPMVDAGKWQVDSKPDAVEFVQTLNDASSGFGYVYRKTVQLTAGKPEMVLKHSIKNVGKRAIESNVYNHNFLVLDGKPLSAGITVTVPFVIQSPHPPDKKLAEIRGRQIVYVSALKDRETVATPLQGFSDNVADHHIRIENSALGAGMTIQADRPLLSESLWSIRSVLAVEPYVAISVKPGDEFTWTTTYTYFTLPKK